MTSARCSCRQARSGTRTAAPDRAVTSARPLASSRSIGSEYPPEHPGNISAAQERAKERSRPCCPIAGYRRTAPYCGRAPAHAPAKKAQPARKESTDPGRRAAGRGRTPAGRAGSAGSTTRGRITMIDERAAPRPGRAAAARQALAVSAGRAARNGIRWLGQGNGSAAPGAVALAIDPGALAGLAERIPRGSVLVTGSNGKGTTCRMLAQVMHAAGLHPITNHEGSNQLAGVTTALLAGTGPARQATAAAPPAGSPAIGLLEVDEGSSPVVFPQIARPSA